MIGRGNEPSALRGKHIELNKVTADGIKTPYLTITLDYRKNWQQKATDKPSGIYLFKDRLTDLNPRKKI